MTIFKVKREFSIVVEYTTFQHKISLFIFLTLTTLLTFFLIVGFVNLGYQGIVKKQTSLSEEDSSNALIAPDSIEKNMPSIQNN